MDADVLKRDRRRAKVAALVNEYHRKLTGRMIPCPGEAHRNAHIDNCSTCMPRWGTIPEYEPIDFAEARRLGLDVALPDLSDAEMKEALLFIARNEADYAGVSRRGSSYCVLRWRT